MNQSLEVLQLQRSLVGHGALMIFLGGVIGFGFLFFLIEKIALWPIPGEISIQLPGTYDAWRMAHMEAIVNGLLLWLTASLVSVFPLSFKALKRCVIAIIVVGWTFLIASSLDPLFENSRGLEFGGSVTNQIAFFLFYVGVVAVMIVMAVIAYRCFKPSA